MFIQECYIRGNSPEIREYLKEIGYYVCPCCNNDLYWLFTINGRVHSVNPRYEWYFFLKDIEDGKSNVIECKNENQFKAIAALRDDSDQRQWFTNNEYDIWELYKNTVEIDFNRAKDCYEFKRDNSIILHKATVQELMEHFK